MICPRCKTEINDEVNYCPHCGMKIERCPICHQPIVQGARYCTHCGAALNQTYYKEQMTGYYQPLSEEKNVVWNDDFFTERQQPTFQDIEVNHKVNKKIIILSVLALVIVTAISYVYLYRGPSLKDFVDSEETQSITQQEALKIESTNTYSTQIGNMNMGGHVFQTKENVYICDENGYLVKMDYELKNQKTLINEECEYVNVVDDTIYFTNKNQYLCSMTTEGENLQVLIGKKVYYVVVKDKKIYYQLDEDKESIYVYDIEKKTETKLNDRHSYCLNVLDDRLYYSSEDGIYSIDLDGKNDQQVISGKVYNLIYQDQKLYYLDESGKIFSYHVENQKTEMLVEGSYGLLNVTENYIFYLDSSQQISRYDMQTQNSKSIYNGSVETAFVLGDKLIVETKGMGYNSDYMLIMDFDGQQQQRLFMKNDGSIV